MMRTFSRVRPEQEALNEYRESINCKLQNESVTQHIYLAREKQRTRSKNAEYGLATEQIIRVFNKYLKEPSELLFFAGGIYECTIND